MWKDFEMKMSEEIGHLAAALAKAQGSIEDALKGSENPYFKSKYADLSAVRSVIREPLAVNDLSLTQFPNVNQSGVTVDTMLLHSSGQYMAASVWVPIAKPDAHGIGSAITYARRYGIMSLLCLASEDDDGNAAVQGDASKIAAKVVAAAPKKVEQIKQEDPPKKDEPQASDDDVAAAIAEGNERALGGSASLRAWWARLPQSIRVAIPTDAVTQMKQAGTAADEAKKDS
jgi:hypothetical protein